MLICDWDDLTDKDQWFIEKLKELKAINPAFKCTVFAIPNKCDDQFLETNLPYWKWIQLAYHGWNHDSNYECNEWSEEDFNKIFTHCWIWKSPRVIFTSGFKAPGWMVSNSCYDAILSKKEFWWVADHPKNRERRKSWVDKGLKVYDHTEYGNQAWHGHVGSVCGNGILDLWDQLLKRIKDETDFKFISEVVK